MFTADFSIFNHQADGKPTIVFLSGLFAGDWIWQKTIESDYFKDNRLVVLKNPLVDYAEGKQSIKSIVTKVKTALLEHKIQNNVCFVGNSLGSLIGLLIAQDQSIKTLKVILSGCPCRNKNINLGIGVGSILSPNVDFAKRLRSKLFFNPSVITDEDLERVLKTTYTRANFVKILKILKELDVFSIESYLINGTLPTKLIWGKEDHVTPLTYWESALNLNPLISLDVLNECGHSPMLEQPEQFNKILNQYIN